MPAISSASSRSEPPAAALIMPVKASSRPVAVRAAVMMPAEVTATAIIEIRKPPSRRAMKSARGPMRVWLRSAAITTVAIVLQKAARYGENRIIIIVTSSASGRTRWASRPRSDRLGSM